MCDEPNQPFSGLKLGAAPPSQPISGLRFTCNRHRTSIIPTICGISPRTALRFNGKRRGVASDRKKYWSRLLNRARLPAARRSAPHRAKGASTVENGLRIMKRWNRLGALEDLGSLLSHTEALAACPMCHSREIWVEKHPNSARSFSIMCRQCRFQVSLLPRAQAIAAWNGMGTAE